MDNARMKSLLKERGGLVERALAAGVPSKAPDRLREAMLYSLMAGGKRLRPVLCITAASLFGADAEEILPFACAIEMIHTYSLIHDDLPAMDDDDLRRGRPSSHKAFDEATAILAGDALQADAFHLMTTCPMPAERVLSAISVFSHASGGAGMCGGQELDMQFTGKLVTVDELKRMHSLKTGAILRASVVCGAFLGGAGHEDIEALAEYGRAFGVAFQIADDILDVVGDTAVLGKPVGSDEEKHKNTCPALLGLERSRQLADAYAARAKEAVSRFSGEDAEFLACLADYAVARTH